MGIGLRGGIGPLRFYIPLTHRRRRRKRRRQPQRRVQQRVAPQRVVPQFVIGATGPVRAKKPHQGLLVFTVILLAIWVAFGLLCMSAFMVGVYQLIFR